MAMRTVSTGVKLILLVILAACASCSGFTTVSLPKSKFVSHFRSPYYKSSSYVKSAPATRNTSKTTSLSMLTAAPVLVAAITGAAAGGLHAIAGPDHLAALLPRCCGQRWYKAGRIGALWGMGHGVAATILGVTAFGLKSRLHNWTNMNWLVQGASSVMEIAVGLSLVVIGLLGIKEAREWKSDMETVTPMSLSAAAADTGVKMQRNRSVIFNGLLHGFSWDGAPSLAPALAVATWKGNLTFLFSYALGTMAAMAVTTTLIGEGTRKAGEILDRPDIPQKLSYVSSFVAILVGAVWMGLAWA